MGGATTYSWRRDKIFVENGGGRDKIFVVGATRYSWKSGVFRRALVRSYRVYEADRLAIPEAVERGELSVIRQLPLFRDARKWREICQGIGPLIPSALMSIATGTCGRCGREVPDRGLLCNALVAERGAVTVECDVCRTGQSFSGQGQLRVYRDRVAEVLRIRRIWERRPGWQESSQGELRFLLLLRASRRAVNPYTVRPWELEGCYGSLLSLLSCQECGQVWPTVDQLEFYRVEGERALVDRFGYPEIEASHMVQYREALTYMCQSWSDEACFSCSFPHQLQWHMRSSLVGEAALLARPGG